MIRHPISHALVAASIAVAVATSLALAQQHAKDPKHDAGAAGGDARTLVRLPEPMRQRILANMRDHLRTLHAIDVALSKSEYDKAADMAEKRLGMSSLEAHGAAHLAPYMPQGMQTIGGQMHRAASRFAVEAQNASVGNDLRPALAALGSVMEQCVACHAAYRLH
jgi:cytochrome c556